MTNVVPWKLASTNIAVHENIVAVASNDMTKRETSNFDDIRPKLQEVLKCISLPIGVFGSFFRFVILILILISMLELAIDLLDDDNGKTTGSISRRIWFLLGCLESVWRIYFLVANYRTAKLCSRMQNFSALRNANNLDLATSFLAVFGGISSILGSITGQRLMFLFGLFVNSIAVLTHSSQPPTLFLNVMDKVGIKKRVFLQPAMWADKKAFAVTLLFEIVVTGGVCWLGWKSVKAGTKRRQCCTRLVAAVVLFWGFVMVVIWGALGNASWEGSWRILGGVTLQRLYLGKGWQ